MNIFRKYNLAQCSMVTLIQCLHMEYTYNVGRLFKCPNKTPSSLKFCSDLILVAESKIYFEYSLFEFCQEVPLLLMENQNKKDVGNLGLFFAVRV